MASPYALRFALTNIWTYPHATQYAIICTTDFSCTLTLHLKTTIMTPIPIYSPERGQTLHKTVKFYWKDDATYPQFPTGDSHIHYFHVPHPYASNTSMFRFTATEADLPMKANTPALRWVKPGTWPITYALPLEAAGTIRLATPNVHYDGNTLVLAQYYRTPTFHDRWRALLSFRPGPPTDRLYPTQASLYYYTMQASPTTPDHQLTYNHITTPWNPATVTWNYPWVKPGGDIGPFTRTFLTAPQELGPHIAPWPDGLYYARSLWAQPDIILRSNLENGQIGADIFRLMTLVGAASYQAPYVLVTAYRTSR